MNTLIQEGGQGSQRINDTANYDFSGRPVGQIEILEDSTAFETVNMQTKNMTSLAWQASQQMVGTGLSPSFGSSHSKGEYISGIFDQQRFTWIKLSAGSIRVYFA